MWCIASANNQRGLDCLWNQTYQETIRSLSGQPPNKLRLHHPPLYLYTTVIKDSRLKLFNVSTISFEKDILISTFAEPNLPVERGSILECLL